MVAKIKPKTRKKTQAVNIRLDDETKLMLEELAEYDAMSMTVYITQLIRREYAKRKRQKPKE